MSFRHWVLLQQAHQRNRLHDIQRTLMVVNTWSDETIRLSDVMGGADSAAISDEQRERYRERAMQHDGYEYDLTQ